MREPYGITIHRDNLYVTDTWVHDVFQFKIEMNMRLVAKLGNRGSDMGQFNWLRGLTVSTNGDVFVAENNNHRVLILDDSLQFQREITHQTMKYRRDIKLTPNEVYVLCVISPYILVFSHAGEKIRQLLTRGMGIGMQVGFARFFCLDAKTEYTDQRLVESLSQSILKRRDTPPHYRRTWKRSRNICTTSRDSSN